MRAVTGVGLGLRNEFVDDLLASSERVCDFLEVAPENWMGIGGLRKKTFHALSERYQMIAHGLSLSLGDPRPIDTVFLKQLKSFFDTYNIVSFSEHLSFSGDEQGLLYDLLPMPFTEEAIFYLSSRIQQVQNYLGKRIAIENISYYSAPGQQLSEVDFINGVLREADCDLLLDINNVYVNSVNHAYCAKTFLDNVCLDNVAYVHMAGHLKEDDVLIDTHGRPINSNVMDLLQYFYQKKGVHGTLIERDNNIPPLHIMLEELDTIKSLQQDKMVLCV